MIYWTEFLPRQNLLKVTCQSNISVSHLRPSGSRSRTTRRLWIRLQAVLVNGRPSPYLLQAAENYTFRYLGCGVLLAASFPPPVAELLRTSTICAGSSFEILRKHRWPGEKFAIRRRKAIWVSDTFNTGTLLSLPEFYGTFIARQTLYRLNGSMRSTSEGLRFGTDSRRRVNLHSFDNLPRFGTGSLLISDPQMQQFSTWQIGPTVRDL
ncbi:UNVERIFIED_CONTAM: hypothetical protein Sangu_1699700 [Sesamum angustifolium]|uniref:Uncharacterized protein n=1 Tax=Sesamum angustifolium TaxID=2727405 RepID=A0AAW2MM41_9LAMI